MILVALLLAMVAYAALAVLFALPAGLFLMLLMTVLHDEVSAVIPTIGYGTAFELSLFLAAFLLFVRPPAVSSSN